MILSVNSAYDKSKLNSDNKVYFQLKLPANFVYNMERATYILQVK